jgi:hypothetical protein
VLEQLLGSVDDAISAESSVVVIEQLMPFAFPPATERSDPQADSDVRIKALAAVQQAASKARSVHGFSTLIAAMTQCCGTLPWRWLPFLI